MDKICLTSSELNRLKRYPIGKIISTEGRIYYYKDLGPNSLLIKRFYKIDQERLDHKIKTIEDINNSELSTFEELVIPKDIVVVHGEQIGFTIEEVSNSTNLGLILKNPKISMEKKIELLKKVGELLRKTMSCDKEFYISDLQPYNVLIDENEDIKVIDLDSSSTTSNKPLESYYISSDRKAESIDKYHVLKNGLSYPDYNSDLLCYNMMILNTLSNNKIHIIDFDEYYDYIQYLYSIGINPDLIESFITLYSNKDNINPVDYLSDIDKESLYRSNYNVYKLTKR